MPEITPQPRKSNVALITDTYLNAIKSQATESDDNTVDYMTDAKSINYKEGLYLKRMNGYPVDPNHILNEFHLNTAIIDNDYGYAEMFPFSKIKNTKGMSLVEDKSKSEAAVYVPAGIFKQDENGRNILDAQGKSIPEMNSNGFQRTYIKKVSLWNPSQTKGAEVSDKFKINETESKQVDVEFLNNKLTELGSQITIDVNTDKIATSKAVYDAVFSAVSKKEENVECLPQEVEVIAELACIALFKQVKLPFVLTYSDEQLLNKEAFLKLDLKYDTELEAEINGLKTPKNVLLTCLGKSKSIAKDIGNIQAIQKRQTQQSKTDEKPKEVKKTANSAIPF